MEEGSIFVLSGEELTLPSAEIAALAETYCPGSARCETLERRVVFSDLKDPVIVSRIAERAAYCRFGGEFVSKGESIEDLTNGIDKSAIEPGKTFAVASETLNKSVCGEVGALIKQKTCAKVSLGTPDCVFQIEEIERGDGFVLGVSRNGFKQFTWRQRRPRARKFFLPSAIYPKLARLLVNLSRVREGEYFLDPFCGTGSLLIESSMMGINTIGIDLTRWIARGAKLNLKGLSLDFDGILRADSTFEHIPFRYVDAISTDVPYGRAASTKCKVTDRILTEFISAAAELVSGEDPRSGGEKSTTTKYCVVMHPSDTDFEYDRSIFDLNERHLLYVHRTLTRAISVLRTKTRK